MKLTDIVGRDATPAPWSEGDNIPWNEPGFSARMLKEHLSQSPDMASRRAETIARQVEWIATEVLGPAPAGVLDLGCGPGLYLQALAAKRGTRAAASIFRRPRSPMRGRRRRGPSSRSTTRRPTCVAPT